MLTIEQLRALPAAERRAYLRQIESAIPLDEKNASECAAAAAEAHAEAEHMATMASKSTAAAAESRAYLATLAAAGLWPVPADGGAPCAD